MVTDPADAVAAVRGAMLFTAVVPEIKTRAALLAQSLARLQGLRASISREQSALRTENEHLEAERRAIAALHERKLQLLRATGGELEREAEQAARLSKKAQSLRELIATVELERRKREAVAEAAAKEAEARAQAEKVERERPKLAFLAARGSLEFPAQGEKLRAFGQADGPAAASRGCSSPPDRKRK